MSIGTQLKKGTLELCVLALISKNQMYGYDLVCELRDLGLLVADGTLYPILSRLEREGFLTYSWKESKQGPPRKYYKLTKIGMKRLSRDLEEWMEIAESVSDILKASKV